MGSDAFYINIGSHFNMLKPPINSSTPPFPVAVGVWDIFLKNTSIPVI